MHSCISLLTSEAELFLMFLGHLRFLICEMPICVFAIFPLGLFSHFSIDLSLSLPSPLSPLIHYSLCGTFPIFSMRSLDEEKLSV